MQTISTDLAPAAIGPYSQAVLCGNLVFCSGQIPICPKTKEIVGKTIEEQAEQVLINIRAILESQGLGLHRVVKTTVFLRNMGDFAKFNEVYARHFKPPYPARSTVEVSALPKSVLIEIEAVACV
jgi:2-iminobutanoate/2-iminopropanoate deaminase